MAMLRILIFCLLISLFFGSPTAGNGLKVKALQNKTRVKIGEPFSVSLFADYPSELQLLFPDSTFSFGNCLLRESRFFPTHTRNGISRDCVVYQLACFHPEPLQSFTIPVLEYRNGDTLRFPSNQIRFSVLSEPDSLPVVPGKFLEETSPAPVALKLNYPYIAAVFILVIGLLLLANFFFDKPVQKFFYLWLERRRFLRFIRTFEKMQSELEKDLGIQRMEAVIVLWKRYLQRLDGRPFLSFTSLEIARALPDQQLKKSLQEIDRWIYGGVEMENPGNCITVLKEKAVSKYELKREQIRNGKSGNTD